jgi:hypothetical protein
MSSDSFTIGTVEVRYRTEQEENSTWVAEFVDLRVPEGESKALAEPKGSGASRQAAIDQLKEKLKKAFTISIEQMNLSQIIGAACLWVWRAPSRGRCAARVSLAVLGLAVGSTLVIDYATGDLPIAKNVRAVLGGVSEWQSPSSLVSREDFFNERFFEEHMKSAKRRVWASGVSFRTLATGNRKRVIDLLDRDVEFKLVLLDPACPLATDTFMSHFSRTAKARDIENTVRGFTGPDGILRKHGDKAQHQLWLSDYAPIVPMVVVDDTIYVSSLLHVDPERTTSAYGRPYWRVRADSDMGRSLLAHFKNMLQSAKVVQWE